MSDQDIIEAEAALRGPAVTQEVYADLAWAIVEAHNNEGCDLNHKAFLQSTSRLTLAQRYAVLQELPTWAIRRIEATTEWGEEQAS
jgi:hypothetical protein